MIFCVLRWTWSFVFIFVFVFVLVCIYVLCFCAATDFSVNKDLYNSVATQKHSSASINTNKVQYKIKRSTIKSITVVDWSINKIKPKLLSICYRIGKTIHCGNVS